MNAPIWIPWILVAILVIVSIILLKGKGSFLIAGYNLLPKEIKLNYNTKRLCHVVGGGTSIISAILVIATLYRFEMPSPISWIIPWGLFVTIAVVGILACTICKRKPTLPKEVILKSPT